MAAVTNSHLMVVRLLLLIGAALAVAGCASLPPRKQLDQLEARTRALEAEVARTNRVSPEQQREFDRLILDTQAYNVAAGRNDISVEQATTVTPCSDQPAFSALQTGTGSCSPNCPLFPPNRPQGYFCLPDGNSYCDPKSGVTVCSYRCVRIPFANPSSSTPAPRLSDSKDRVREHIRLKR